jgi:hypothetical protein
VSRKEEAKPSARQYKRDRTIAARGVKKTRDAVDGTSARR